MLDHTLKLMHIQGPGLTNESITRGFKPLARWQSSGVSSQSSSVAILILAAAPGKCLSSTGAES